MDNVGIVVESLDKAIAFFMEIGLKLEGRAIVEGDQTIVSPIDLLEETVDHDCLAGIVRREHW